MAYTTINKSIDYFNTKLYTGNDSSSHSITGVGFQPDWTWIKIRNASGDHGMWDSVRGTTKRLVPNNSNAESTTSGVTAFGTDGFTMGASYNASGNNYASWNWKAGNSAGSSNTDGSTNTISTSVNTTAGFSISTYTGTGSAATIGHGLGVAPKMIIVKRTSSTDSWTVGHDSLGWGKYLRLDTTAAEASNTSTWYNTAPTSTVFSVNHDDTNANGVTFVVYCFAEKAGYSKFGSYIGNGNNDGTFVYTGFKPAWVMIKKTTGDGWQMFDNKRDPYNAAYHRIEADSSAGDYTGLSAGWIDMVSNGFKVRYNGGGVGSDGVSYIYMAFGQSLVGSNNVPCTAR